MSKKESQLVDKVEYCLITYPETRNSDLQLTFRIINTYMPEEMLQIGEKWFISTKALKEIREDNVKRYRCLFNNKGKYLPTDLEVIKQRKLLEKQWREELSPSNPALF